MLKFLVDKSYQASASPAEREKAKAELELQFTAVLNLLEENNADNRVISKAKALSPSLFNIYKEARQSSRFDIARNINRIKNNSPANCLSSVMAGQQLTTSSSFTTTRTFQWRPRYG